MLVRIENVNKSDMLVVSSRNIAEDFEKRHDHILRDIDALISGMGSPQIWGSFFIPSKYTHEQNKQEYKEYLVTRDGFAMLVMGFNGDKALRWKMRYIEAFNAMEDELKRLYKERQQWEIERAKEVMIRHITDTIKMKIADSPNKRFAYPNYTKLIYQTIFGKPFKELQEDYGVKPKESLRDYLTAEQLKEVEAMEMLVSSLINIGMGYQEIKDFIAARCMKQIAA